MKKTLWLFLGFMLSMMGVQAQVMPSYSFVSSSGTYEEISGGTVLATAALAGDDFDGKVFGAEGTAVFGTMIRLRSSASPSSTTTRT